MSDPAPMYLVTVAGAAVEPLVLDPNRPSLRIGRHESCELALPVREDRVSRFHARMDFDGSRWRLTDLNSRWGTFVNGSRLTPQTDLPLGAGDLIRISPWTFRLTDSAETIEAVQPADFSTAAVRNVVEARLADEQLSTVLECTSAIHEAGNERDLAEKLIDGALRGTGMNNAAYLRPVDAAGRVQVFAQRFVAGGRDDTPRFSRSLLAAAGNGQVAELQAGVGDISQSIVSMNVSAALCVPILLGGRTDGGGTIAAYLYLDSRNAKAPPPRQNAAAFGAALGRLSGLALANLKRVEVERRQALIESELTAAAATQRWILPKRQQQIGPVLCVGESRPGRFVGGDFFDIIPLGPSRVAVALGDVSGKGVAAGVLMTAAQGYLHACLIEHGDVQRAIAAANRFIAPRTPDERFVTLWLGVIDLVEKSLTYIDAGHGYAMLQADGGAPIDLRGGTGVPLGIDADFPFASATVELPHTGRLLVVSDGLIEQPGVVQSDTGMLAQDQFGVEHVRGALAAANEEADFVAELFASIVSFAGTTHLADDATAVLAQW